MSSARPAESAWPSVLPQHLSATQLELFARCPESYRRRYICGERERAGQALVIGAADHRAAEYNFAQKIHSGTDIPMSELEDAYHAAVDEVVERNGGVGEIRFDEGVTLDDARAQGLALARVYHEQVAPGVQPVAVERRLELVVPRLPVIVEGRADVVTAARIVERKTSGRLDRQLRGGWRLQGMIYAAATGLAVEWHVGAKTKHPAWITGVDEPGLRLAPDALLRRRTERLVGMLAQQLHAMLVLYGEDGPWPGAITHPWACGFCSHRSSCSWWVS